MDKKELSNIELDPPCIYGPPPVYYRTERSQEPEPQPAPQKRDEERKNLTTLERSKKHISKRGYRLLKIIILIMYICMVFGGIGLYWEIESDAPDPMDFICIGSAIFLLIFIPVMWVWTTVVVAKYIDVPKWYHKMNKINWILLIILSIIIHYVGIPFLNPQPIPLITGICLYGMWFVLTTINYYYIWRDHTMDSSDHDSDRISDTLHRT